MVYITCPHCGHVFQIKRDTFAIAGMNSTIDQRIEDGTHFTHVCQKCKNPFYMMHPFLYRDPIKKFCVILSNQKEFSNLPDDERIIVCKSVSQFLLAYRICSEQLDFQFILHKLKMMEERYEKVKFESFDQLNQCLWFTVNDEKKALLLKNEELDWLFYRNKK